nr:uncharacterized mitochondrial protein AtMg00810-like [Tanacetum cinerariifolium]
FIKYKTAHELWATILKTFGGNEATKKTKKNQLKQQYGNFKAEGKETLEQTFNRVQAINMSFISLAKISSGKEEVNTTSIPTASTQDSPASANVVAASISLDTACTYIASQSNGSQIKYKDINQIDEDDIEEMDIKWNMALLSIKADKFWKKTGKKISIQGTDVAGFDKSKVECFNCHKISHFARECRAPRSQDMEEDHALVADQEALIEFALMAKSSYDNERSDKNKQGLGYIDVPPPAQVYSPPKKDMSWTGLFEFADDTITDYSRPSPSIKCKSNDLKICNSFVSENRESFSSILSKPEIKNMKASDSPTVIKTNKDETVRKPSVKYAEMYRKISKSSNVRGLFKEDQQLELNFEFQEFPLLPKSFPLVTQNFPLLIWEIREKLLRPQLVGFGSLDRTLLTKGNSQNKIDDKGYWDSGCSRHMTGNISYLSDYEPFDGGYVSFGQGGCKIIGKETIKTGKLEFENVYFVKDLKYNLFSLSQIYDNKNSVIFTDSECIVLGRDFKLRDYTNVLLRTPRQYNMYSINLNNIVPHKDLTCLVAKASADESELWHRRLRHLNFKIMNKLVRHNLVRGLPSKCYENDHTCAACLKGKQHKASCKTKLVHSVTKPLHTLHIDLFGPTPDETSGILKNFITEIENMKDLKDLEFPTRVYKVEKAMGTINQTLFIRKHREDFLLVQVYVDDIIFGSSNPQLCKEFEAVMHEKFQMSAMGELNFFLGLQVLQKKDVIFLSQDKYVGVILKKFGYSDVRSANTPMDKENPWGKDRTDKDVDLHLYRSMIGSLMYFTTSRPDIMFTVCACAQHQVTPKECHLHAVKRIFRYLKGHPKLGIWYPKDSPFDLVAYSDSDYGGTTQDRKSTTGGCQFLGRRLIS